MPTRSRTASGAKHRRSFAVDRTPLEFMAGLLGRKDFYNDSEHLLGLGRMAVLPLALALDYIWSRQVHGTMVAGVLSLALFVFDPNFIAHGGLVTVLMSASPPVLQHDLFLLALMPTHHHAGPRLVRIFFRCCLRHEVRPCRPLSFLVAIALIRISAKGDRPLPPATTETSLVVIEGRHTTVPFRVYPRLTC